MTSPKSSGSDLIYLYGIWTIRFDATGEDVFDFDVVDIRKGGKIEVTHVSPK